jgi:hypothetical protein
MLSFWPCKKMALRQEKVVGKGMRINRRSPVGHTSLSHFGYQKPHKASGYIKRIQNRYMVLQIFHDLRLIATP